MMHGFGLAHTHVDPPALPCFPRVWRCLCTTASGDSQVDSPPQANVTSTRIPVPLKALHDPIKTQVRKTGPVCSTW